MNPKINDNKTMWRCGKCNKLHANYRWATDCCLPIIKIINHMTGEELNLPFGIKRLGYSNECVICDAFGYDEGRQSDSNNSEAWEIISIEGWTKNADLSKPNNQEHHAPAEQSAP